MVVDAIFVLVIVAGIVVPGDFFSTEGYQDDRYYDHIIDLSVERLKLIRQGVYVDVNIKDPKTYGFLSPVEGTMFFDGLRSLTTTSNAKYGTRFTTKSKRLKNGDLDLLVTFHFSSNISGSGNFTEHGKEVRPTFFEFGGTAPEVQVLFMLTKDSMRKRVTFQFVKPPVYDYPRNKTINMQLLLEENAPLAFKRLFKNLYDIIYGRVILTAQRRDPYFDNILDKYFHLRNINHDNYTEKLDVGRVYLRKNRTELDKATMNLTVYGLNSLTRASRVHFIDEVNGDLDLRVTIKFGNISVFATVVGSALDTRFVDSFNFTSPPTEVEALFYLPRNTSFRAYSFHFLEKPEYTISLNRENLRSSIEKVVEDRGRALYGNVLNEVLNITRNAVFP